MNMSESSSPGAACSSSGPGSSFVDTNQSSPQGVVDCQSLTNCMNKNKQSLQVKLQLRRPFDVLVDQGILPPLNESARFYEQKHKLERAKTGDFLRNRIQRRPKRDELVQANILDTDDAFDPNSYEEQRKQKKARLADDLNEKLSHRPGPLELIKTNILHTDETLEQAVKGGQIEFKKTSEGEIIKNLPPRFVFEEESCSSDSSPSPPVLLQASQLLQRTTTIQPSPLIQNIPANQFYIKYQTTDQTQQQPLLQQRQANQLQPQNQQTLQNSSVQNIPLNTFILTTPQQSVQIVPASAANSVANANTLPTSAPAASIVQQSQCIPTVTNKGKKKNKNKSQPKARVIKFHEYTGPPNAKKQSSSSIVDNETSYELLLKQQQLFLQWQLESQHQIVQSELDKQELNNNQDTAEQPRQKFIKEDSPMSVASIGSPQSISANMPVAQVTVNSAPSINSTPVTVQSAPIPQLIKEERFSVKSPATIVQAEAVQAPNSVQLKQIPIKKIVAKLEDMKVSDLKAELKKRNLPVSGAKKQLIERLQQFSDSAMTTNGGSLPEQFVANSGDGSFVQKFIVNPDSKPETNNNYVFIPNQNSDGTFPTAVAIPVSTFIPQYQFVNQPNQSIILQSQPQNILRAAAQPNIIQAQLQPTKTIGIANQPIIQQLILYPNSVNSQQIDSSQQQKNSRSNSLPSQSLHQLQRNSSMPVVNPVLAESKKNGTVTQQKTLPMAIAEAEKQNCEVKKIFVTFDGEVVVDESNQIIKFNDMNINNNNNNNNTNNNNVTNSNNNSNKTNINNVSNTNVKTTLPKKEKKKSQKSKQQNSLLTQTETKMDTSLPNNAQIQPDSTTNPSALDLDFLLDFEELREIGEKMEAESVKCHPNELALFNDSSWLEDLSFMAEPKHIESQQAQQFVQTQNIIQHNNNILSQQQLNNTLPIIQQQNQNSMIQIQNNGNNSMVLNSNHLQNQMVSQQNMNSITQQQPNMNSMPQQHSMNSMPQQQQSMNSMNQQHQNMNSMPQQSQQTVNPMAQQQVNMNSISQQQQTMNSIPQQQPQQNIISVSHYNSQSSTTQLQSQIQQIPIMQQNPVGHMTMQPQQQQNNSNMINMMNNGQPMNDYFSSQTTPFNQVPQTNFSDSTNVQFGAQNNQQMSNMNNMNNMKNANTFVVNNVAQQCHYAANSNFNSRTGSNFDTSQTDFLMDFFDDFDFRSNDCPILN